MNSLVKFQVTPVVCPNLEFKLHDFHPSQHPIIRQYQTWLDVLQQTSDPIAAGNAFWQAAYPNE
ncbi:hypothetical protein A7P53_10365 [Acinetobacter defluvii]|nr:hypothetical protein [Acinetobacter defluvii]